MISRSGTLDFNISDHEMFFAIRKKLHTIKVRDNFMGRSYRNFDYDQFATNLLRSDWRNFYLSNNVDECWDIMLNIIHDVLDPLCRLKQIKIKKKKDPWVSNDLLELIHDKYMLLKRAKRTGLDKDLSTARIARNYVAGLVKDAKRDYVMERIDIHKNNHKKFWDKVHLLLQNKQDDPIISLKHKDTGAWIPQKDIPDYINTFFVNIGTDLSRNNSFEKEYYQFHDAVHPVAFELTEVTEEDVLKEIGRLEIGKSSAIDHISTKIFKDAFTILLHQLTHFSISIGIFPTKWKTAKVTPIPKDGDLSSVNNYRPISLLPVPSKILEHLIQNQLLNNLEANDILDGEQGGFRKGRSTSETTASLLDDIYLNMNNQILTSSVFVNFSKAFDSINHELIFLKLQKIGMSESALNWFKSYLTDRQQTTIVKNRPSMSIHVQCGVPQGSVLGPTLFLIFINDLSKCLKWSKHKLYADDVVIYTSNTEMDEQVSLVHINEDVENLRVWCIENAITMNVKKTKYMSFGTRQRLDLCSQNVVNLNNQNLKKLILTNTWEIT